MQLFLCALASVRAPIADILGNPGDGPRHQTQCRLHQVGGECGAYDGTLRSVCLTVDASGGLKSRSARGPEPISEGGGNASPAREDGRYGEATEAQRRKPGNG